MEFKVKAKIDVLFKSGDAQHGPWFLYRIKENIGSDKTKTWSIFCNTQLSVGDEYEIEGVISEGPSKTYFNQAGKPAYQTTFNAKSFKLLSDNQSHSQEDFPIPKDYSNEEIPF